RAGGGTRGGGRVADRTGACGSKSCGAKKRRTSLFSKEIAGLRFGWFPCERAGRAPREESEGLLPVRFTHRSSVRVDQSRASQGLGDAFSVAIGSSVRFSNAATSAQSFCQTTRSASGSL